jgi:hypothetical protein
MRGARAPALDSTYPPPRSTWCRYGARRAPLSLRSAEPASASSPYPPYGRSCGVDLLDGSDYKVRRVSNRCTHTAARYGHAGALRSLAARQRCRVLTGLAIAVRYARCL